jgi:hypothetical protein
MNIRNLLLTSIMVCAPAVMHATTEEYLTSQEQELVQQWFAAISNRPAYAEINNRKVIHAFISLRKDLTTFILSKVQVGDLFQKMQEYIEQASVLFHEHMSTVQIPVYDYQFVMWAMNRYEQMSEHILDGEDVSLAESITQQHIAMMKKSLILDTCALQILNVDIPEEQNVQPHTLCDRLSQHPVKAGLGLLGTGIVGYLLYRNYR